MNVKTIRRAQEDAIVTTITPLAVVAYDEAIATTRKQHLDRLAKRPRLNAELFQLVSRDDPSDAYDALARLQAENDTLKADNAILTDTVVTFQDQAEAAQIRAIVTRGPHRGEQRGHVKRTGELQLWRARNTGHCDAQSLLQILCTPGSRNIVLRAERMGGAAHLLRGRDIADSVHTSTQEVSRERPTFYVVCIYTDAFSSSTSRTDAYKHQVTQLVFAATGVDTKILWCDLKSVEAGNSTEFRSIIIAQLKALHVLTWLDELPPGCFGLWIFVADDGPDVSGAVFTMPD